MASVFDKKEEVLDIILTREGRELMSKGKFKPAYYEFYDSEIIYEADNSETQNASKERIEAAIYQKNIPSIDSINELGGTVKNDNTNMLKNPLGSYQVQNEYAPAWNIKFEETGHIPEAFSTSQREIIKTNLSDAVVSSGSLKSVDTFEERIPQFYVNVNYVLHQYVEKRKNAPDVRKLYFDNRNKDLLITLDEQNAFELEEPREFEIEIFRVIDETVEGGSKIEKPYTLERLYFDSGDFESKTSVEKYFNVLFDEEARLESNFKKKNIYSDIIADPEEVCEWLF